MDLSARIPSSLGDGDDGYIRGAKTDLLYGHGSGGILVSTVTSGFLTLWLRESLPAKLSLAWWGVMLAVLAVRGFQVLRWRQAQELRTGDEAAARNADLRHFRIGVFITASLWAAFPLLFFNSLTFEGRAAMAIILSGMAGGSATVLAAEKRLAFLFCGALLIPGSLCFVFEPAGGHRILGVLGLIFYGVMTYSAQIANKALMRAIRLNEANKSLIRDMKQEQARSERANTELTVLHKALLDANQNLESKVHDRTEQLVKEIHERERFEVELCKIAATDSLTGLCNRATMMDWLSGRLNREVRPEKGNTRLAILFIDLDKFKEVNDVRGHHAGDQVLRVVADRFTGQLGPGAVLARWGGDEFLAVLENVDRDEAAAISIRLRESLTAPIEIESEHVRIDATIGIAVFPDHGKAPDELIRAADVAMYAGKQDRRSSVRLYDPALTEEMARRHIIAQSLGEAIVSGKLWLAMQPIVRVPDGSCVAMEALVRWNHPTLGPIAPGEFIPLAERSRDILPIGRWILMEACRIAATWTGPGAPAVSVNVSPAQVMSSNLIEDVTRALHAAGLPANRLHIELTESLFVDDRERVLSVLSVLRGLGVRISLDDFGTGFSSLGYLQTLPVDSIKIDQSFVREIEGDSKAIVTAIVSMARALGFGVVAEGVETPGQLEALSSLGVADVQGYLIGLPMEAGDVSPWLVRAAGPNAETSVGLVALQAEIQKHAEHPFRVRL